MLDLWSARQWTQAFVQITSSAPPLNLDDFPNKHFFQLYVYTFKNLTKAFCYPRKQGTDWALIYKIDSTR